MPPVENIKRRRTVFNKKKLRGPPRLRFRLFLIETKRKTKTKNPIKGTEYFDNSLFCHTKTRRNEAKMRRE